LAVQSPTGGLIHSRTSDCTRTEERKSKDGTIRTEAWMVKMS
jgi:hypothetical protein